MSGEIIADIYLGKITHWQDARIAAINPEVDLPDLPIHTAHRSDSSGTTHIFTDYLGAVSPEWAQRVGRAKRYTKELRLWLTENFHIVNVI